MHDSNCSNSLHDSNVQEVTKLNQNVRGLPASSRIGIDAISDRIFNCNFRQKPECPFSLFSEWPFAFFGGNLFPFLCHHIYLVTASDSGTVECQQSFLANKSVWDNFALKGGYRRGEGESLLEIEIMLLVMNFVIIKIFCPKNL